MSERSKRVSLEVSTREKSGEGELTLEEDLEYTTSLFVNQTRDTLDSSTTSETTDRRLGDTLDVVTQLR
jgi:hypothetical protein